MFNQWDYLLKVYEWKAWIVNKNDEFLSMDFSGNLIDPENDEWKYPVHSKYELQDNLYEFNLNVLIFMDYIKDNLDTLPEGSVSILSNMKKSEEEYRKFFWSMDNEKEEKKIPEKKMSPTSKKEVIKDELMSDSFVRVFGKSYNLYSSTELNKVYGMNFNTIKRGIRTVSYNGKYILKEDIINNFLTELIWKQ